MRRRPVAFLLAALVLPGCRDAGGGAEAEAGEDTEPVAVVTGFSASEAVRHDPRADVYLLANISGEPTGRDDDGFISRVSPRGEVETLRWIDGAAGAFELNAPKGMALEGGNPNGVDVDEGGVMVLLDDGSYLVSSWDLEAVLRVAPDGTVSEVLGGVPQAADIGFDEGLRRVLVPTFADELHLAPLPEGG